MDGILYEYLLTPSVYWNWAISSFNFFFRTLGIIEKFSILKEYNDFQATYSYLFMTKKSGQTFPSGESNIENIGIQPEAYQ